MGTPVFEDPYSFEKGIYRHIFFLHELAKEFSFLDIKYLYEHEYHEPLVKGDKKMDRNRAEEMAYNYFCPPHGFNCAEAISKTIVELYISDSGSVIPKAAAGFGGGIGHSIADTCGALTGGVIALSYLFGRTSPEEDNENLYKLVTLFRDRFIKENHSTNCTTILEAFGPQDKMTKCRNMTARAAGIVCQLIADRE